MTQGERHCRHLDDLDQRLLSAMSATAQRIGPVVRTFVRGEETWAEGQSQRSRARRTSHVELERSVHAVLAGEHQVARDVRHTLAVMRAVDHLRRADTLLDHVVASLEWTHPPALADELLDRVVELSTHAGAAFTFAVEVWSGRRTGAEAVIQERRNLIACAHADLHSGLLTERCAPPDAVTMGLVGRYMTRVGHHGLQLARLPAAFAAGQPD